MGGYTGSGSHCETVKGNRVSIKLGILESYIASVGGGDVDCDSDGSSAVRSRSRPAGWRPGDRGLALQHSQLQLQAHPHDDWKLDKTCFNYITVCYRTSQFSLCPIDSDDAALGQSGLPIVLCPER